MALILQPLPGPGAKDRKTFSIPPGAGTFSLGRMGNNDFPIDHVSVSSLHAKIEASGVNGVSLIDCGSRNGTFVNGEKIDQKELSPGDLIRIAGVEFRLVEMSEKEMEGGAATEKTSQIPLMPGPSAEKIEELERELSQAKDQLARAKDQLDARTSELEIVERQLADKVGQLERKTREHEDANSRAEKLSNDLSAEREGNLERESQIAALQFELSRRDGMIKSLEAQGSEYASERDEWQIAHDQLQTRFQEISQQLDEKVGENSDLQSRYANLVQRVSELSGRLLEDWRIWFQVDDIDLPDSDGDSAGLDRVDAVRGRIRKQLDSIEPIWDEFGDGVQDELRRRCNELRKSEQELVDENREKQAALDQVIEDLAGVREKVDEEIRRAQGLSRRGLEIEIPERFESMVIAKDREQGIFQALIQRLEFFDHLLAGYRRNRKMKAVVEELEKLRAGLAEILTVNGVEEFDLPVGFPLTLKERKKVQILGRKGWGTREFMEQPFQPGEVTKIVRTGYQAGAGDSCVILRKVEVLIREAGD